MAIVRLADGGWGQSPPDAVFEEYPSRNRLLGNREHPLDKAASEWLYVWPILTHQVARPGAISIWNRWAYPKPIDFFVPIDSVAVFDHLAERPVLDSVECFVVCGHALWARTFQAIQARVSKGATCIIAKRLYDRHASGRCLATGWSLLLPWIPTSRKNWRHFSAPPTWPASASPATSWNLRKDQSPTGSKRR